MLSRAIRLSSIAGHALDVWTACHVQGNGESPVDGFMAVVHVADLEGGKLDRDVLDAI